MRTCPLEYLVIGLREEPFSNSILPELHKLQKKGHIRVVDLLFVSKTDDGEATLQEVGDLSDQELALYEDFVDNLLGLLTQQDAEHLASILPPGTEAAIVLLEHSWALGLTNAIVKAGACSMVEGWFPTKPCSRSGRIWKP
jgi:hypothetical protein